MGKGYMLFFSVSIKRSFNFAPILIFIFEGSKLNQRDEVKSCFFPISHSKILVIYSYRAQVTFFFTLGSLSIDYGLRNENVIKVINLD